VRRLGLALAAFDVWLLGLVVNIGPWINLFAAAGVVLLAWLLWTWRSE
jgi:hypothetical protein